MCRPSGRRLWGKRQWLQQLGHPLWRAPCPAPPQVPSVPVSRALPHLLPFASLPPLPAGPPKALVVLAMPRPFPTGPQPQAPAPTPYRCISFASCPALMLTARARPSGWPHALRPGLPYQPPGGWDLRQGVRWVTQARPGEGTGGPHLENVQLACVHGQLRASGKLLAGGREAWAGWLGPPFASPSRGFSSLLPGGGVCSVHPWKASEMLSPSPTQPSTPSCFEFPRNIAEAFAVLFHLGL